MNNYLQSLPSTFAQVFHPAAGREVLEKKKRKTASTAFNPKATPDSLNLRSMYKSPDGFRRNPAP